MAKSETGYIQVGGRNSDEYCKTLRGIVPYDIICNLSKTDCVNCPLALSAISDNPRDEASQQLAPFLPVIYPSAK